MSTTRYIQLFTEPPKRESDWRNIEKDIQDALKKNVPRVQQCMGVSQGGRESVYVGDTGVAFMDITLASLQGELPLESTTEQNPLSPSLLISLADRHFTSVLHDGAFNPRNIRDGAHISFLDTPVGTACLILSRYPFGRQQSFAQTHWKRCRDYLLKAVETIERDDAEFGEDDDGCEMLYGRAGFLYALLYLRNVHERMEKQSGGGGDHVLNQDLESCKGLLSDATMDIVAHSIIRRGRNGAKTYQFEFGGARSPSLMWAWHGKRYLGGAHGIAGILQMLLRCPFPLVSGYMPEIVQTIDWLVTCQDRAGNWPTRAPGLNETTSGGHELVQWCHGAPAMLILLSTILRMAVTPGIATKLTERQQDRFVVSLQRGCAVVYMRGLLRKGVGLCHGIAGSVYALLAASDVLDSPCTVTNTTPPSSGTSTPASPSDHHAPYFTQAAHLAHLATYSTSLTKNGDMKTPDHPWSLYEGMAGMCCAWGEILYRMKNIAGSKCYLCSGMPGYDDFVLAN
ncbi:hypothetical protein D9756_007168 [Leucocoprinus leucothites]|uniref:Uncharacterized protein n=1 Tax=Leucocoprinus leucothites TaxID=201217 RepID=A0A8H5FZ07_9AGAR|nr:hypothetical protein D9756_007168 [Leucoagaricus leucothites]